jgi:hypothetical protein
MEALWEVLENSEFVTLGDTAKRQPLSATTVIRS